MTLFIQLELGKLYSVPFADGVIHGVLRQAAIVNDELILEIKPPLGEAVTKRIELPRRLK